MELVRLCDMELEAECEVCKGARWIAPPGSENERICHGCNGEGKNPTEFGEKVLKFIAARLKVKFE